MAQTRCCCGSGAESYFMVQCESCYRWQHGDCVGVTPETGLVGYICYACVPSMTLLREREGQGARRGRGRRVPDTLPPSTGFGLLVDKQVSDGMGEGIGDEDGSDGMRGGG